MRFHSDEYIKYLKETGHISRELHWHFNSSFKEQEGVGSIDCPLFEGVLDYSKLCAGGSMQSAIKINKGEFDTTINWSGGHHHAKKASCAGFCYINDIVLAILELLRRHK